MAVFCTACVILSERPVLASPLAGDWWNASYAWRRNVTLTDSGSGTPAGTVVSLAIDHAALVTAGKSLANGNDVRLAYWDGANWSEVSRALASASSWNNASTQILFKTTTAIAASGTDNGYYLYFGNPSAVAPTVTVPTARWYKTEQLAQQSTADTSFEDVPGTTLTFTPGDASETWLIFVSGVLRSSSTSTTTVTAEMRLRVNGTEVDYWGHHNNAATSPNGAGFLIPHRITGTAAAQTIQPQFRAGAGTTYATTIRVVAAMLPPDADLQFAEAEATQQLTGSDLDLLSLTFTPAVADDYLVFGKVSQHETPSTSTVQCWVEDDAAVTHPNAPAGTHFSNARRSWNPFTTAFRKTLPTNNLTYTLRGTSSGSGTGASEWRYARLMAVRMGAWESNQYSESLTQSTTTSNSFQNKTTLTTALPPAARDYLVIQNQRMSGSSSTTARKAGELRDGGVAILRTDHRINSDGNATTGYHHVAGVANVKQASAAVTYDNGFLSPNATTTVQCADSTISVLRYRDASSVQGADEPVPTVTFTSASQSAAEVAASLTVTAQLSAVSGHDISVPFTLSGTASTPADYSITASPITITAGNTTADITIDIAEDLIDELDQTVIVTMGNPVIAAKGATTVHTATILDNDVAGVTVTQSGGSTNVTEGGATDTYTVVLDTEPAANVTITITPDGQSSVGSGAGVARQLTFTSANWSTPQTVTVTAYDDPDIEGAHTSTIAHTVASTDTFYDGITVASVTANITDNDTAGVNVTESGGATNVTEGGATDTYTVVLNSRPTVNVTVTITPDGQSSVGSGAGVARQLTFSYANWSTPQTVTVTAYDDPDVEGAHTSTITHAASSADTNYDGIGVASVTANITDNDTAAVTITESGGTTAVTEGGATDTYTVVLNSRPTNDVTITVTPDAQSGVGSGAGVARQLTFTYANWNTAQTITVTPLDDAIAETSHTSTITHTAASADANYNGIGIADVTATITDNDIAYVNFSLASQSEMETAGTMTLDVTISIVSSNNVTVPFTLGGTAATPANYTITPSPVTITAGQLSTTITITIVDNFINNPDKTVILTMGVPTKGTAGTVTTHTATIIDDEPPGITVTESGGATTVIEGGATDTYTLVLQSQPLADVTIDVTADGKTTVNPASVTFTDANWNVPRTITVTAVNDAVAEGLHSSLITHAATSADGDYHGIAIGDVTATITDNDTAGATVTQSGGTTAVTEGGATDSYTVVLTSEPTADVTITVGTDGKTTVDTATLTFTAGNWSTPQTVTVTAVDDAVAEGVHSSSITHTTASADAFYNGIAVAGVTASITDNDTAGVTVAQSGGTTTVTEGGATDSYTLVLTSEPLANVVISVSPDSQTTVSAASLTFTAGNWSTPQTITVTAVNDAIMEGAHNSTITHTAASADGLYDGIAVSSVTAAITDNDTAGVTITQSGGTTTVTEGGATDTYTLVLTSEPVANVTIEISPDVKVTVDPTTVTFTSGNWNTPQTITVTAVDDAVAEGTHSSSITHAVTSADSNYDGMSVADVTPSITDNDIAYVNFTTASQSALENAGPMTVTITIPMIASNNVTIPFTVGGTASNPADYTITASPVTIPAGQLSTTITITVNNDAIHEADETVILTIGVPTNGTAGTVTVHTATILDDEPPGVTIAESGGTTVVTETGTTDTYTLVLRSQPLSNVTISVNPDGNATVNPASVVFTSGNWNTSQTITVTAVDDAIAEGAHTSTIAHVASSADPTYDGIAISNVTASVTDNDTAGVTITQSGGSTAVAEGGATDSYTLVLKSQPLADVTITINPDADATVNPSPATFTVGNWNVPQTITVTAVDDDIAEGAHTSTIAHVAASADPTYDGIAISNVTANVTDNDTAGVTISQSGGSTAVTEGGATDSYTVVLTSEPTADVTVAVSTDGKTTVDSATLTFTAGNWSTPQTVTVTAVNDAVAEGAHSSAISHSATSADGMYNGIAVAGVTASITDNDTAAVDVTESGGSTGVTEGGATDTYTIVLHSEPTAEVVVAIDTDGKTTVNPTSVVFTTGNWNVPRTITVTADNDDVDEGAHTSAITHEATSADANYNGIVITGVTANITDNDTAGVSVTQSGGSTDVAEGGATDSYLVVLNSQPVANVTVSVTPDAQSNVGPGAGVAKTLTFTAADWDQPQTVTVTAADDAVAEGAHNSVIAHAATSADPKYNGIAVAGVTVNITDNDTAGVDIAESGGSTSVIEGGATDTYTVVLHSKPTANVVVTVTPAVQVNLGAGAGTAVTLTFTAANWNTSQTITVAAVDNAIVDGARTSNLTHAATSADANYNGIGIAGVTVNIADDDVAYVNFSLASQSAMETDGTITVDLTLSNISTSNVTVPFTLGGTAATPANYTITASPVTITAGQSSTTITITLVDNFFNNPDKTVILTIGAPANGTAGTVTTHTATIIDDEPPGITLTESGGATAVTEGGATDSYTLVLQSMPFANVTISMNTDGKATVNPTSLTFTAANWNVPQAVTVTAVNDAVAEGTHASLVTHTVASADGDYNGIAVADVTATITDNDTAGVTITQSGGTTTVIEGGVSDSYTVVLTSEPTADVTIAVSTDGESAAAPASLTFTAVNWNVPQTVTVSVVNDDIAMGSRSSTITHASASADTFYNGLVVASVTANVTDDDVAGVTVSETGGVTNVTEGAETDTYTVVLRSQPTAAVSIAIGTDGQSTTSTTLLTFTAGNWSTPQTVTVTAVNDTVAEGAHTSTIAHASTSVDSYYNGVVVASVTAHITDNDTAGVSIAESGGTTAVSEAGLSDSYTIVLDSQPIADVTITVTPAAHLSVGSGGGVARVLTFTTANWNVPRTMTITAIDDTIAQGDSVATITHAVASADPAYNGFALADVSVDVEDDDTPGVGVSESGSGTMVQENGIADSYTIVLETTPIADVFITVTVDNNLDIGAGQGVALTLTFTPLNWHVPQTVTVTAYDDEIYQGSRYSTITHTSVSADSFYNALDISVVIVDVRDDESPPGSNPLPSYAVDVSVEPANAGTVIRNPSQYNYLIFSSVTLAAFANPGYRFKEWRGDLAGGQNPAVVMVSDPKRIVAFFETYSPPPPPVDYGPTEQAVNTPGGANADVQLDVTQSAEDWSPGIFVSMQDGGVADAPGIPENRSITETLNVTIAGLTTGMDGQITILADVPVRGIATDVNQVTVYRWSTAGWAPVPVSYPLGSVSSDGKVRVQIAESLSSLLAGSSSGDVISVALQYMITMPRPTEPDPDSDPDPDPDPGQNPDDSTDLVNPPFGFCGATGIVPLMGLALGMFCLRVCMRGRR